MAEGDADPAEDPPLGPDLARAALARAKADARSRGARGAVRARPGRSARQRSGAGPDERDPQPFGAALQRLVTDRGWDTTMAVATVMGRWDVLVGSAIAAHCRPVALEGAELTVVAESTAWATQLRLLGPTLLARLSEALGAGVVTGLRVYGPTAPNWQKGPRRVTGSRGPRDTYG